jgi:hypothetical protein
LSSARHYDQIGFRIHTAKTLCFGTARFQNWLWRVPFLLSVVLAGLGTYVRMLDESRLFKAVQSEKRIVTVPLLCVLLDGKRQPHWRSG